ncbi:LysR substrate-binding domain-containing protein [Bradyrhizobium sp. Ash2021]|uniref:LysR substrate-binding domain-containing protein n=1 Tax=Bradyrhizobium sp. Ash2021 TaxID=2954771 RepID=UPI0028152B01|nr:LysR substrate-binding domain-containing protein [Bradyrhizobium sp. Ash2021]WMT76894.1 LysR substrate-binding domain-containing protein [Bradyrhizobium sp. Ash2021]
MESGDSQNSNTEIPQPAGALHSIANDSACTAGAKAGLGIVASSLISAKAELESGELTRILSDWDFGSMEVNALFVSGKTIKPAARAFTDFFIGELRR